MLLALKQVDPGVYAMPVPLGTGNRSKKELPFYQVQKSDLTGKLWMVGPM